MDTSKKHLVDIAISEHAEECPWYSQCPYALKITKCVGTPISLSSFNGGSPIGRKCLEWALAKENHDGEGEED
jgi:hypothetical protein